MRKLNTQLIERYLFLVLALEFIALGIVCTVHAELGITPISCPVYVLSLKFTPTLGEFTIAMHILFIILQIILLRNKYEKLQLFQVVIGIVFGVLIDITNFFFGNIYPSYYLIKIIFICIGSMCIAIGVVIELVIKTIVTAGEGIVFAIITVSNWPLDKTKIGFDLSLLFISITLSLYYFRDITGVREGTLISALLVGYIAGIIKPFIQPRLINFIYRKCPEKKNEKDYNNAIFIDDDENINNGVRNIKDQFISEIN